MIKPVAPACDPGIPSAARQRLVVSRSMLYDPEAPSRVPVFRAKPWAHTARAVFFYSLFFALGVVAAVNFTGGWQLIAWIWVSFFGISGTVAAILLGVRARHSAIARRYRGRFIDLIDLEAPSRHLLVRAKQAIAVVLGSVVHSRGLLDKAANEVILRQNEWEIATTLRHIRALRAKAPSGDPFGPISAAVAARQARVLVSIQG